MIAGVMNPLKSINNYIVETERHLDNAKKNSLERIKGKKEYRKLSPEEKFRYDSSIDYYKKAHNLLFNNHEIYTDRSVFPFYKLYKSIIIIFIIVLFLSIVVSGFKIFMPDVFKSYEVWKPATITIFEFSGNLDTRVSRLENSKLILTYLLIGLWSLGILASLATYMINVWKVRSVARKLVGKKLEKFSTNMSLEIESRTSEIDNKLIALDNKFSSIENMINDRINQINQITNFYKKKMSDYFKTERKRINKNLKSQRRQYTKRIMNFFRR